jgi:hypothetical protein
MRRHKRCGVHVPGQLNGLYAGELHERQRYYGVGMQRLGRMHDGHHPHVHQSGVR